MHNYIFLMLQMSLKLDLYVIFVLTIG